MCNLFCAVLLGDDGGVVNVVCVLERLRACCHDQYSELEREYVRGVGIRFMTGMCGRRLSVVASVFMRGSASFRRWTGVLPTLTLLWVRAPASPVLIVLEQDGVGLVDLRTQCGVERPLCLASA